MRAVPLRNAVQLVACCINRTHIELALQLLACGVVATALTVLLRLAPHYLFCYDIAVLHLLLIFLIDLSFPFARMERGNEDLAHAFGCGNNLWVWIW